MPKEMWVAEPWSLSFANFAEAVNPETCLLPVKFGFWMEKQKQHTHTQSWHTHTHTKCKKRQGFVYRIRTWCRPRFVLGLENWAPDPWKTFWCFFFGGEGAGALIIYKWTARKENSKILRPVQVWDTQAKLPALLGSHVWDNGHKMW